MEFPREKENFGEVFKLEEWKSYVAYGAFTDYDGTGYYGTSTHYCLKEVFSEPPPENATHVHWFNK